MTAANTIKTAARARGSDYGVGRFRGAQPALGLPVDVVGTAFLIKVWSYLQKVHYGEVQSYSEVAAGIGEPKAVRAVARACARNRVALLVPCHRVIRGDGAVGGYCWGMERNRALMDREHEVRASGKCNPA